MLITSTENNVDSWCASHPDLCNANIAPSHSPPPLWTYSVNESSSNPSLHRWNSPKSKTRPRRMTESSIGQNRSRLQQSYTCKHFHMTREFTGWAEKREHQRGIQGARVRRGEVNYRLSEERSTRYGNGET